MKLHEIRRLLSAKHPNSDYYQIDAREVAERAGVHVNTIKSIRQGKYPSVKTLEKVEMALRSLGHAQ